MGVNAELFSRDKQNVTMLLSLLEEPPAGVDDFHVHYHALQILTGLSSSVHRLQEARPLLLHITCRQNTSRHADHEWRVAISATVQHAVFCDRTT